MWQTIDSTRVGRADHQPGRAVLRRRRRRRHRVQDEPVQHRRRRPVPARRAARGRRRGGRVAAGAAARAVRLPRRRSSSAAAYAAIAGDPQGVARRQRGDLDDHAQLHRHRHQRLPAVRAAAQRVERQPRPDHARCRRRPTCRTSTRSSRCSASTSPTASFLRGFLPFAIVIGIGYWLLLNRSRFGFNLRVSGANAAAARTAGVNPKRMVLTTIILSGADRRADRPRPAADRGVHVRRPVPEDARLHRASRSPCSAATTRSASPPPRSCGRRSSGRRSALSTIGIPQEIGVILQGSFLLAAVIAYEVVKRWSDAAEAQSRRRANTGRPDGRGRRCVTT